MPTRSRRPARAALPRAFSLLELMLVLAIIGVLMAVAAYNVLGQGEQAKTKATQASMQLIKNALSQYQLNNSAYPPSLTTLVTAKILEDKKIVDGWDSAFYYSPTGMPGQPFQLISPGPDKLSNTPDDINIWTINKQPSNP